MTTPQTVQSTCTTGKTSASKPLTEADLRQKVDVFLSHFSPEYLSILDISDEYCLTDDRMFRTANKRRLDSVFTLKNRLHVVEFKRGVLSENMMEECGFVRGYYELCYRQLPCFTKFIYVAEDVTKAKELCKKVNTPEGIEISCYTYPEYLVIHAKLYAIWSKNTHEKYSTALRNLVNAKESVGDKWFNENQLYATIKYLTH
jgi:hypothetical protein